MDEAQRKWAIEKVRKCLELASSPEAGEAAAALRQAQKLMRKYGISESEVDQPDIVTIRVPCPAPPPHWAATLMTTIGPIMGVRVLFGESEGQWYAVMYGPGHRLELMTYALEVTGKAGVQAAEDYINKRPPWASWTSEDPVEVMDNFLQGFASTVGQAVTPLVLTDKEKDAMQAVEDRLKPQDRVSSGPSVTHEFIAGMQRGATQAGLLRPMTAGTKPGKIGE